MSYFLHYFEKSNPNANWQDYAEKSDTIMSSFNKAAKKEAGLLIQESEVNDKLQKYSSYIISDGISSDRFISDPEKKNVLLEFLKSRVQLKNSIPCFTLLLNF